MTTSKASSPPPGRQRTDETVLFVTPWLEIGGAERIVQTLVADALSLNYRTTVAAARGSLVEELPRAVEYVELGRRWIGAAGWRNVMILTRVLSRSRPAVVNAHSLITGLAVRLAGVLGRARPRVVVTIHSTGGKASKLPLVGLVGTSLFDSIITVSEELRTQLSRWTPPRRRYRIHVVRAGRAAAAAHRRSGRTVAIVGRLVQLKGHHTLLDAWALVMSRPEARGWSLEVWGDGPEMGRIGQRLDEDAILQETVILRGVVPRAAERLGQVDVLVLPSLREGLPLVLIEGMAAGVPVLASDLPGCRELVGSEAGLLFPPGDAEALAEGLLSLIRDPDRRVELGAAGLARVQERFPQEAMLYAYRRELGLTTSR